MVIKPKEPLHKTDRDIQVLAECIRALNKSTSPRMLRANLEFLWGRFVSHPEKKKLPEIHYGN